MNKSSLDYAKNALELCVLPDVYLRLQEMLHDGKSTLADISDVVSLDPAIASTLLKIANSSLFNFPREIDSISRAITILGVNEVTNLVNTYGVTAAFSGLDPDVLDMDKFWEISIDCSLLTKFLAKKAGLSSHTGLFLSGLLHNIGALALVHSERVKVQLCENYDKNQTPWQLQQKHFGFTFAECGADLLTLWNLPASIIQPIREFHQAYTNEDLAPTSKLLYITSRLALINSHPGMYNKKSFLGEHLLNDLNLCHDDIDEALNYCNAQAMSIFIALNPKK